MWLSKFTYLINIIGEGLYYKHIISIQNTIYNWSETWQSLLCQIDKVARKLVGEIEMFSRVATLKVLASSNL